MRHALVAVLTIGLIGIPANGQQEGVSVSTPSAARAHSDIDSVDRAELLRVIAQYEDVAHRAEAQHFTDPSMVKVYVQLGGMYYDVAMFPKAEDAMRRAIVMLRQNGPQDQLAEEIGHLAELHIATGRVREAEKDHLEALKIRESIGDPVGLALTWTDLASLYVGERQYKKAVDFGERAYAIVGNNSQVTPTDRVAIRQILGTALSETHDSVRAIPILKDAVAMAESSFGADSLSAGIASYVLGNAYWHSGDLVDAGTWMQRGTARMKLDLGWGHPAYVDAIANYAKFLRARGQMEAAATVEREVKQANSIVDARSLTTRSSAFAGALPQ
jgi:tetratricopeptide (TPR) repeat protein